VYGIFSQIIKKTSSPAYGMYTSQLIRYSKPEGSFQDFLDRNMRSGRVCSSCCNSGTCCATIAKNLLTSHGRGKEDRIVTTTNGIYLVICDTYFYQGNPGRNLQVWSIVLHLILQLFTKISKLTQ
jgi:hypothetical protein